MPRSTAFDAGHTVLTDHSIPRIPGKASPPQGHDLVTFLGNADDRAIGLAYAETGDPRARAYLLRAQPSDAPVMLRLAFLEKDTSRAVALYESALKLKPDETVALVNLGTLYAASGRATEAARLWRRALEINPGIEEAALNLAQILPSSAAEAVLKRYLEVNPSSAAAKTRFAEYKQTIGK
jgi:tetratricopeptide (TPR) repeat protein